MNGSSAPEELLAQLAASLPLTAVCVPDSVRQARPRLEAVATRLGIDTTRLPIGHEDLLCQLAAGTGAETAEQAEDAARAFSRRPFLLLIPEADANDGAVVAARRLTGGRGRWLARDLIASGGATLLAPVDRLLDSPAMAGEWYGVEPPPATELERARELEDVRRELDEIRRHRERAVAEIARLRADGRGELDRTRAQLLDERAWVREQVMRIASSTSWRLGHGLARLARLLVFKRDRGTNLPRQIAERIERDPFR